MIDFDAIRKKVDHLIETETKEELYSWFEKVRDGRKPKAYIWQTCPSCGGKNYKVQVRLFGILRVCRFCKYSW